MRSLNNPNARTIFWTVAIVGIACVVRFVFFYDVYLDDPALIIDPDSKSYIDLAGNFTATGTFSSEIDTFVPEFRRTPGYPILISAVYAFFGEENLLAVVTLQHLAFFVTVLMTAYLGFRVGGHPALIAASALLLLDFTTFYFVNEVYTETVFTFLLLATALSFYLGMCDRRPRISFIVSGGILLAFATLVRPASLYLIYLLGPVLVAYYYWYTRDMTDSLKLVAAIFLPWFILIGGWYLRNFIYTGELFFTAQHKGIEIVFMLRAQSMAASIAQVDFPSALQIVQNEIQNPEAPVRGYITYFLQHPLLYLEEALLAVGRTLFSPSQWYLQAYFPKIFDNITPIEQTILSLDIEAISAELRQRAAGFVPVLFGVVFQQLLLFSGFIVGVVFIFRLAEAERALVLISVIIVGYFLLMVFLFVGNARFRVPFNPLLAIVGGYGISALLGRLRRSP